MSKVLPQVAWDIFELLPFRIERTGEVKVLQAAQGSVLEQATGKVWNRDALFVSGLIEVWTVLDEK